MHLSADRRQPPLNLEDLLHLRWLLGGGLALLSIGTLFHLEPAFWPVAIVAAGAILVAMGFPALPARAPRRMWRLGMPAIAIAFAVDLYASPMIPAFVRLTVMLVVHRAVSHRSRREDLQLVVLCLFLVIVTGVLTVSLAFAVQIVAFTGLAMAFLFVVNLIRDLEGNDPGRREGPPGAPPLWALISRKRLLRRLWHAWNPRLLALAAACFAVVILGSTVIFLAIPRYQMGSAFSLFHLKRTGSMTGFSEAIALGEVTEITQDHSIAMRVDVQGAAERPPVPYWRMVVLDEYGNGTFRVSRAVQARVGARSLPVVDLASDGRINGGISGPAGADPDAPRHVVFLESGISRYLPLPGAFDAIRFREIQEIVPNPVFQVYATQRMGATLLSFRVEGADFSGVIPDPDFATVHLRAPAAALVEGGEDDSARQRFLSYPATTTALPVSPPARAYLRDLVREIGGGETLDAAAFAQRACDYLARTHRYSLGVSLPAGEEDDPVVRWMRHGLSGHCEFFAASFTLLSRAAGYPTRAVTGFKGGTWNAFEHYYMVRNSDAHAWCEVYDGRGAWFRVDPTPGAGGVGGAASLPLAVAAMPADRSMAAYVDSLRMVWYRRIVSFDRRSQREVAGSIRKTARDAAARAADLTRSAVEALAGWLRRPWTFENRGDLLAVLVLLFVLASFWRRSGVVPGDLLAWLGTGERATRRRAGRLLRRLEIRLSEPVGRRRWDPAAARALEAELRVIRFGRAERWPDPLRVFRAARRML